MPEAMSAIGFYGYTAEALSYFVVCLMLLAGWRWDSSRVLLAAACLATAAWAGVAATGYQPGASLGLWEPALNHLRQGLWIAALWSLLHPELTKPGETPGPHGLLLRTGLLFALWLGLGTVELRWVIIGPQAQLLSNLILVTVGLVLIENLLRRAAVDARWGVKFLCIGLGGAFAYDLILIVDGFLSRGIDPALESARGVVQVVAAVLIGVSVPRIARSDTGLTLSRSTAFYTGTLTAGGVYLCLMALATVFVGRFGGEIATTFQAIFLFGATAALAVLLASGKFRAHLRNFINQHFFQYKYDYRREWLRFTETLSTDNPSTPLEERVIKAIAQILDSPAGALWLHQDGQFALVSAWNLTATSLSVAESSPLGRFLEKSLSVIDIPELSVDAGKYDNLALPPTLARIERAWTIVPLMHHQALVGIVLLAHARAPRDLDLEDIDLLKTLGRHAASYIAEQEAGRALAETREFEKLNRRFAFVLHDMKNLVSRLSLLSSNFTKHGERPEFRKDMVGTLVTTTEEMKRLMGRLQGEQPAAPSNGTVMLHPMLEKIVALNGSSARLDCQADSADLAVVAEPDRLSAVFSHLFDNANEAIGKEGQVRLHLQRRERSAVVELVDNGCGMDREFIERELFRPFRSTKRGGFGLGAFQCREYVRELGGDLEIVSSPGTGTTVRVILPAASAPGDNLPADGRQSAAFME
jgi:putative PEP-CTERM system histidine kinase